MSSEPEDYTDASVELIGESAKTLGRELAEALSRVTSRPLRMKMLKKWRQLFDEKTTTWPFEVREAWLQRAKVEFMRTHDGDGPEAKFEAHIAETLLARLRDGFEKHGYSWARFAAGKES